MALFLVAPSQILAARLDGIEIIALHQLSRRPDWELTLKRPRAPPPPPPSPAEQRGWMPFRESASNQGLCVALTQPSRRLLGVSSSLSFRLVLDKWLLPSQFRPFLIHLHFLILNNLVPCALEAAKMSRSLRHLLGSVTHYVIMSHRSSASVVSLHGKTLTIVAFPFLC